MKFFALLIFSLGLTMTTESALAQSQKTQVKRTKTVSQHRVPRKKKRNYAPLPAKENSSREPAAFVDESHLRKNNSMQMVEIPHK